MDSRGGVWGRRDLMKLVRFGRGLVWPQRVWTGVSVATQIWARNSQEFCWFETSLLHMRKHFSERKGAGLKRGKSAQAIPCQQLQARTERKTSAVFRPIAQDLATIQHPTNTQWYFSGIRSIRRKAQEISSLRIPARFSPQVLTVECEVLLPSS